jgi:hypothetical protein
VTLTDFGDLVYLLSKTFKLFGFPNHLLKGEKKLLLQFAKLKTWENYLIGFPIF